MTVRDIVNVLNSSTRWRLIGARSGKKLCTSENKEQTREKYMNMKITDSPISPSFYTRKNPITGTVEFVEPMIDIWVSGE